MNQKKSINSSKSNTFLNSKSTFIPGKGDSSEYESVKEYFSKALMSPLLTSSEEKTLSSQIKSCDAQILSFEKRMLDCEESEKNKIVSFLKAVKNKKNQILKRIVGQLGQRPYLEPVPSASQTPHDPWGQMTGLRRGNTRILPKFNVKSFIILSQTI